MDSGKVGVKLLCEGGREFHNKAKKLIIHFEDHCLEERINFFNKDYVLELVSEAQITVKEFL